MTACATTAISVAMGFVFNVGAMAPSASENGYETGMKRMETSLVVVSCRRQLGFVCGMLLGFRQTCLDACLLIYPQTVEHAIAYIVYSPIAPARRALQTLAIENRDMAAAVPD
jgi:hypothetical protein